MPRGIARSRTEQKKENLAKVKKAGQAEELLAMLSEIKADIEKQILSQIAKQPVCDLESIQYEYKACHTIMNMLHSTVVAGKLAEDKLKKEEE